MAKRFTETNIWTEDWFMGLPNEYKLFWFYLKDQCNHAGIWSPNLKLFQAIIGVNIDLNIALNYFNKDKNRIRILESGHWFIEDFFSFQYGNVLNLGNRVHQSIHFLLLKENINLTSIRGLIDLKDGVKDKDKDKNSFLGKSENPFKKKYSYSEIIDKIHRGEAKSTDDFEKVPNTKFWVKK